MAIDRTKIQKLAENYMATGKTDRAIDEFMKLIEDRPDDFQLLNRVGDAFLQAGKVPEAIDMFKRAGAGFERDGFNAKATAVFKKAHRVAAEDVDISERLAELYRSTNMVKEAIQIHMEVAEIFTKKGLIKRALEEFAKVVELDPKILKNKVKLADLYNKEGMKERAANIYLEVAEALALEQMHSEANQILERAKTMVTTPQVFLTQSKLCVIQKDLAGAAEHLREGLAANPRSPELLDALAEVELQARSPERALEALADVPQLPEKSLQLCERALRDMVRTGHVDEALRLFKPIGREFSRRGLGEAAGRALRAGLGTTFTVEAWVQLAEIAHQIGNKPDYVDCLRHALALATQQNERVLVASLSQQLQALGVQPDQMAAPPPVAPPPQPRQEAAEPPPAGEATDLDPVRRMQIQQLERDGDQAMRSRFMDRALEAYARILDLEPANERAINRIADIHRSSGVLTKVQMHYVKTAEKVAPLGFKRLAVQLLDQAEAMFPGSTRLYRRTLGLLDVPAPMLQPPPDPFARPAAQPDPFARPVTPGPDPFARQAPLPAMPLPPPPPPAAPGPAATDSVESLPLIELDHEPWAAGAIAPVAPSPEALFQLPVAPVPAAPETFQVPDWEAFAEAPAPAASAGQAEFDWAALTAPPAAAGFDPGIPDLVLEPLPFVPGPQGLGQPVDDELASTLSDIDFQLDYGSPEEAKIEIECSLQIYPQHPELLRRLEQAELSLHRLGHEPVPEMVAEADFGHSFFDLTDVLGDALMESGDGEEMHDATNVVEKIQSVDELFNAFREGVEQQVKGDDFDTHYNLGIAYKEMLLLDPAIEEFKKAMRDPERTLECCSMLSICEQELGHLDNAVRWLRQGIEAPGFPPEDAIGLHYDLGLVLAQQGLREEALVQFRLVREQDPEYREVTQFLP
jgi:tetratricopeptide (TPR) repeat protein